MHNINKITVVLMVLLNINIAYAELHYKQSCTDAMMAVGSSADLEYGEYKSVAGEPGVGLSNIGDGTKISFATFTPEHVSNGTDNNNIYTIQSNNTNLDIGVFKFAKITDANVYFGEWSKVIATANTIHQSYYIGKDVTTLIPMNSATYSVIGISQYSGNNLLSGTFSVDFVARKIEGALVNTTRSIDLDNGNLYYDNNQVTFSAHAKEGATVGVVAGAFFGNEAEVLAGIITYGSNHIKDIGFGGSKNSSGIYIEDF